MAQEITITVRIGKQGIGGYSAVDARKVATEAVEAIQKIAGPHRTVTERAFSVKDIK